MDEQYECEACGFDSDIAEDFCESFIMEKAAYGKVCIWCYDEYQQACDEAKAEEEKTDRVATALNVDYLH